MKRVLIASVITLFAMVGCSSSTSTKPSAPNSIQPYYAAFTTSSYFSGLWSHLTQQIDLDEQRPMLLKELRFTVTAGGELQSGSIEFRGTDRKGKLRQFVIQINAEGRWSKEEVPIYGDAHEFVSGQTLLNRLDKFDWKTSIENLGTDRVRIWLNPFKKCQVEVHGLNPPSSQSTGDEPVLIDSCS